MSQKIPANNFEWIKDTSQFDEDFMKIVTKKLIKQALNHRLVLKKVYRRRKFKQNA